MIKPPSLYDKWEHVNIEDSSASIARLPLRLNGKTPATKVGKYLVITCHGQLFVKAVAVLKFTNTYKYII